MNINIIGVSNNLSYGIVTKNVIKSLTMLGHSVHFKPLHKPEYMYNEKYIEVALNKPFYNDAPQILIWHQNDLNHFVKNSSEKIGWPIFELDTLTEVERASMNSCDRLFVCSKWAKNICGNNNIKKPIDVVPLGVDYNQFKPTERFLKIPSIFTFSMVGKWEIRKGHDVVPLILKNIKKPFFLNVCCNNPFYTDKENREWEQYYKKHLGDRVKFFSRFDSQDELYNFMSQSHCGISVSRAEGWNLPVLEYMSIGRKVITTNYSAMTEFCDSNNSLLVHPNGFLPAFDGKWFFGQGSWCKFSELEAERLALDIVSSYYDGEDVFNYDGVKTARNFSWENSASTIVNLLRSQYEYDDV